MKIDTRFLTTHPRTVEWWEQRETCRQCKHWTNRPFRNGERNGDAGGGEFCKKAVMHAKSNSFMSCISSRERECGPEAKLYEVRDVVRTPAREQRDPRGAKRSDGLLGLDRQD